MIPSPSSDWYHAYRWGRRVIVGGTLLGVWAGWWWGALTNPHPR